jgi:hypothetical protein
LALKPWWENWPERLKFELDQLQAAGVQITKLSKDSVTGILEMQLEHVIGGRFMPLSVRFTPFFPYTRFELFAPDLALAHHQNPFQKNVCLIGRASENWDIPGGLLLSGLLMHANEEVHASMKPDGPKPQKYTLTQKAILSSLGLGEDEG